VTPGAQARADIRRGGLTGCGRARAAATLTPMDVSQVQIRRAGPDEWATVRDLRLAALTDAPGAFAATLGQELARAEPEWRARISAWPWFVAWRAGEPAGLGATGPAPARPGQAGSEGEWRLTSMWVTPGARGAGLADRLISAVLAHARAAGAARVTLWVALGNARARAVYLRMGFAPTGRREVYRRVDGAELDEEELAWTIGGPP
jgi:ribosomal protein S18 acetylase RimI-like enzyme